MGTGGGQQCSIFFYPSRPTHRKHRAPTASIGRFRMHFAQTNTSARQSAHGCVFAVPRALGSMSQWHTGQHSGGASGSEDDISGRRARERETAKFASSPSPSPMARVAIEAVGGLLNYSHGRAYDVWASAKVRVAFDAGNVKIGDVVRVKMTVDGDDSRTQYHHCRLVAMEVPTPVRWPHYHKGFDGREKQRAFRVAWCDDEFPPPPPPVAAAAPPAAPSSSSSSSAPKRPVSAMAKRAAAKKIRDDAAAQRLIACGQTQLDGFTRKRTATEAAVSEE